MKEILRDLHIAARRLLHAPAFTLTALLTLGLAIGANTAVFNLMQTVVLSPLPYPHSERLVSLWHTAPGAEMPRLELSHGTYLHYRQQSRLIEEMAVYRGPFPVTLTGKNEAARLRAVEVTFSFFRLLGPKPLLGRVIQQHDDQPDAPPAAVLSHRLWTERFGGEPGIVDRAIRLNGESYQVLGVMHREFAFPSGDADLWLPLRLDPQKVILGRFSAYGIGRLRPGVTAEQARADLISRVPALEERFPGGAFNVIVEMGRLTPQVTPLKETVVGDVEPLFWILFASVGFVLLVAAANILNLILVRAEARQREMAVRQALGAGRWRMAGHFLAEGLILAFLGGALGLLLAAMAAGVLRASELESIPRLAELKLNAPVMIFAAGVSAIVAAAFALIPSLDLRKRAFSDRLREGRTAGLSLAHNRSGSALVVAQIAAALLLVAGAGLMARSSWNLAKVDPGFDSADALNFRVTLPARDYPTPQSRDQFVERVRDALAGLPGVKDVGTANCLPLSGCNNVNPLAREDSQLADDQIPPAAQLRSVSAGYFEAMGIRLVEGRFFAREDFQGGAAVAVVGQQLAQRYWPGASPIGKRILPSVRGGSANDWFTIVGVVGSVRSSRLERDPDEIAYFPLRGQRDLWFVVRTEGSPLAAMEGVQVRVREIDPNLPIAQVQTLEQLVVRAKRLMSLTMVLLAVSAGAALLIGVVGVYGVLAYAVSRRRGEIGVRMALGARSGDIRMMILAKGLLLALGGIALGVMGSLALSSQLEPVLFGVGARDAATYAAVSATLFLVVLLASYFPARRAARQDPNHVLRQGVA